MSYIDKKEFLRSFAIRPDGEFNIFFGAGASVQANISAAGTLIWQFKWELYCDTLDYKQEKFMAPDTANWKGNNTNENQ